VSGETEILLIGAMLTFKAIILTGLVVSMLAIEPKIHRVQI
jgi:hypothetical protein